MTSLWKSHTQTNSTVARFQMTSLFFTFFLCHYHYNLSQTQIHNACMYLTISIHRWFQLWFRFSRPWMKYDIFPFGIFSSMQLVIWHFYVHIVYFFFLDFLSLSNLMLFFVWMFFRNICYRQSNNISINSKTHILLIRVFKEKNNDTKRNTGYECKVCE